MLWHYTAGGYLDRIVASGVLRPAHAGVAPPERPVVWFSQNSYWEQSASKPARMTDGREVPASRATTERYGGGLARIAVADEVAPYTIDDMPRLAGTPPGIVKALKQLGRKMNADAREWRFSLDPVANALWNSVELWNLAEGAWMPAAEWVSDISRSPFGMSRTHGKR